MSAPSFQRAPRIKRIDLVENEVTAHTLVAGEPFVTAKHRRGAKHFEDRFEFDGQAWYHVAHRWPQRFDDGEGEDDDEPGNGGPTIDRRWALHGTQAVGERALFLFMEHPEARHPELEAALSKSREAVMVYADWLEEQGDPYAASLNPELLKSRGPAGEWFLEGLDRSGAHQFTLERGLVKSVTLSLTAQENTEHVVLRLCAMRACAALRELKLRRPLRELNLDPIWALAPWPRTLQRLSLGGPLHPDVADMLQAELRLRCPELSVDGALQK